MDKGQKFFLCKHCGNLIGMIHNSGSHIICCGDEMTELNINTSDGAYEKHLPVVTLKNNEVSVFVGSTAHPMTAEHHIEWIYLQMNCGGHRNSLEIGSAPEAHFVLNKDEKPIAVFSYCNNHDLWKAKV